MFLEVVLKSCHSFEQRTLLQKDGNTVFALNVRNTLRFVTAEFAVFSMAHYTGTTIKEYTQGSSEYLIRKRCSYISLFSEVM